MIDVERANTCATSMEKKQKQFDKLIADWRQKCEDITMELEVSQRESRLLSAEMFKLRAQYEESLELTESVRRENKNLADEVRDLIEQLGEGGRERHEMEKEWRMFGVEKEELQMALEETEALMEEETKKVGRLQMELAQARHDIDRRLKDKEEEFEIIRLV